MLSGRYYDPLGNRPSMSHQFQSSFGPLCCQEATPFVKVCCVPGKEWYHIDILWHLTYLDNHKCPHPLSIETFIETLSTHLLVLLPPAPVRWMLERRPPYINHGSRSWRKVVMDIHSIFSVLSSQWQYFGQGMPGSHLGSTLRPICSSLIPRLLSFQLQYPHKL